VKKWPPFKWLKVVWIVWDWKNSVPGTAQQKIKQKRCPRKIGKFPPFSLSTIPLQLFFLEFNFVFINKVINFSLSLYNV